MSEEIITFDDVKVSIFIKKFIEIGLFSKEGLLHDSKHPKLIVQEG